MSDVDLASVLSALADPVRLRIVQTLSDGHPHPKTAHLWQVDVQKSTLSHHFRILRESGLTRTLVTGRSHAIQLRREELDERFPGLIAAVSGERG